jgi:hypothetical protein
MSPDFGHWNTTSQSTPTHVSNARQKNNPDFKAVNISVNESRKTIETIGVHKSTLCMLS